MNDSGPYIDATVFMGMHHADERVRQLSLGFFRSQAQRPVSMNFEQIGICDAVVWRQTRAVQDAYYPFMDLLHSEMPMQRSGYNDRVLQLASTEPALRGLRTDRALLAAQVLCSEGALLTHDPALLQLQCLQPFLRSFDSFDPNVRFNARLEALYELSRKLIFTEQDWPC
jgi:hypothetical protein